jgi:hypothetical protein
MYSSPNIVRVIQSRSMRWAEHVARIGGEERRIVMRHLTTGIRSEKYVVRRFRRCANVIKCTYTNLDSIAYYIPLRYGRA